MRAHVYRASLVRACLIVATLFLIVLLPLTHAEAASTKGMGNDRSSSQSGDGKSGKNKPSPSGGGGINKGTPRAQPGPSAGGRDSGPSSGGNAGNAPQRSAPPGADKPNRTRKATPKPDRGPNKFSPKTRAPQTQTKNSSERNRSSRKKRERREEQQQKQRDRRTAPSADRLAPRYEPTSPRRDDDGGSTRLLNGPGAHGIDGEDDDHDGIIDNEQCDVVCPLSPVPPMVGGGFPGMRPPAAPGRQAPPKTPAPRQSPAPRTTEPRPSNEPDEYRDRGDGRDAKGRYANGNDGRSGKDAEKRELDKFEDDFGVPIIRDQRRASFEGGKQGRFYDGLIPNGDGTYSGIEIKSGSAGKTPQQKQFDARVSPETPATVTLPDGTRVKITHVIDRP